MKTISHVLFAGAIVLGCGFLVRIAARAQAPQQTHVVHIVEGDVQGLSQDTVDRYLGIPYASPPVGDLRWKPPQAPAPWTQTLLATKFGNTCAQQPRGVFASPSNSEDCLYLNVFT